MPACSSTRQWRAMRAAFSPISALNNPTMMSCPGDTARKNGIWGYDFECGPHDELIDHGQYGDCHSVRDSLLWKEREMACDRQEEQHHRANSDPGSARNRIT